MKTRPDTRLPMSRAGGQGQWWNRPSSWAGAVTPKPPINAEKAKCNRWTNVGTSGRTDGWAAGQSRLQSCVHSTKNAETQLLNMPCWSISWSIRPSICPSFGNLFEMGVVLCCTTLSHPSVTWEVGRSVAALFNFFLRYNWIFFFFKLIFG